MLQRINFVMMIVVVLLVVGVGMQVMVTQSRTAEALNAISSELGRMKSAADVQAGGGNGISPGLVFIDGDIQRNGQFQLPAHGSLTLKRLIASAGGVTGGDDARVTVTQLGADGKLVTRFSHERAISDPTADLMLLPNDHVQVGRHRVVAATTDPTAKSLEAVNLDPPASRAVAGGEIRKDDDQFPKLSPFRAVRWKDEWTPMVNVDGTWYELLWLGGAEAKEVIDHCRLKHGDAARQRFSEDLPQMLLEMGRTTTENINLKVKHLTTGTVMAINGAEMTAENRNKVVEENRTADDHTPRWTGEPQDAASP